MISKALIDVQTEWGVARSTLHVHAEPAARLAVLFPGNGYQCDAPLLWYTRKAALLAGCDTLSLAYGYPLDPAKPMPEQVSCLAREASQAISQVLKPSYGSLLFISKSLGTVVAGEVAGQAGGLPVTHLFLTPLGATIPFLRQSQGVMVSGTADKWFGDSCRTQVRNLSGLELVEVPGAGHSLELDGDLPGSLQILSQVCEICTRLASRA
ncbi:MAG TPA: hypothetical protein VNT75_10615 [Symbiobacteriaceae bacterium]|nr:hypothetical protein [Symbiobacteriaceae bacterium]